MQWTRRYWLRIGALLGGGILFGCTLPNLPPPGSTNKFVKGVDTQEARGQLGVGTGWAATGNDIGDGTMKSDFLLFPAEGTLTSWLSDRYGLSFSVGSYGTLGIEGNLQLGQRGRFRLGLVHGIAVGLMGELGGGGVNWDGQLMMDFPIGFFFQTDWGKNRIVYGGLRYVYGFTEIFGDQNDAFRQKSSTHFLTASTGIRFPLGKLTISPELVLVYGRWLMHSVTGGDESSRRASNCYYVFPMVFFSSGF